MRKKFIDSNNNLKNYNEKITRILLPFSKYPNNDRKMINNSNRVNIRSKYKKLKNISKIQNYREIFKSENSVISSEKKFNRIKVNKNEALFLKLKITDNNSNNNDNNSIGSNYLKTENDIDHMKYKQLRNKTRNEKNALNIRETSATTNSKSKFLFYKRLKSLKSLSNDIEDEPVKEIEINNNKINNNVINNNMSSPDEKKLSSTHKIFNVNLNLRNNKRNNNKFLYSSERHIKCLQKKIENKDKEIDKEKIIKDKETEKKETSTDETKEKNEKEEKNEEIIKENEIKEIEEKNNKENEIKEIEEKNNNENEIKKIEEKNSNEENIKKKEQIMNKTRKIKLNAREKYRLGLTKSIENNKSIYINMTNKIKKSIFRKNYIFEINSKINNISNIYGNYKTSINENIQVENIKNDKYEIIGKDILQNKELLDKINKRLKTILSKYNIPPFDLDNYKKLKSIGEGTYGQIYEVINKSTEKKYAIKKILSRSIEKLEQLLIGFEISNSNPHENIINVLGIYIKCLEKTKFVLYVLMDLADSDWDIEIKKRAEDYNYYTEKELIEILKQISSALIYLQKERKIAHRDIKPENILIFENNIYKLCDFGEAKISPDLERTNSLRGTEIYMSPILYNSLKNNIKKVKHNIYKSDVFSFGYCFLYASCLNYNLIHTIRDLKFQGLVIKILNKYLKQRYSQDFIEIISKMINNDENFRPDFIEIEKLIKEKFSE